MNYTLRELEEIELLSFWGIAGDYSDDPQYERDTAGQAKIK